MRLSPPIASGVVCGATRAGCEIDGVAKEGVSTGARFASAGGGSLSRCPQLLQKFALCGLWCPQLGQTSGSSMPQLLQNLASSGFEC